MALAFFYWRITKYLKKTALQNNSSELPNVASASPFSVITAAPSYSTNFSVNRRSQQNECANKTLRNLIIVYICLVWPGRIFLIISFLLQKYKTLLYFENYRLVCILEETFNLWVHLNNVVNVFVYAILIGKFRSFLRKELNETKAVHRELVKDELNTLRIWFSIARRRLHESITHKKTIDKSWDNLFKMYNSCIDDIVLNWGRSISP